MGNKIARTTQVSAAEYYLHDLPSTYNLVLLDVISRGRFLKSVRCKHDEGLLLVKVYFKHAGEPIDLKEHERRLERIRNAFKGIEGSHIWPLRVWLQIHTVAYLLRQYFFNNMHDRISTRPFLSLIAKKWLAFQVDIFNLVGLPLVENCLSGFNSSIFDCSFAIFDMYRINKRIIYPCWEDLSTMAYLSDRSLTLYDLCMSSPAIKLIMKTRCNSVCSNPREPMNLTALVSKRMCFRPWTMCFEAMWCNFKFL